MFVRLRERAAQMAKDGSLMCMPVLMSASTVAAASSFESTSSGLSKVKDLQVPLLPTHRAWLMVREVLTRVPHRPGDLPLDCPDKVATIFDWAGGMPRKIAWGLSAMSRAVPVDEERLLTGRNSFYTLALTVVCHSWLFVDSIQQSRPSSRGPTLATSPAV